MKFTRSFPVLSSLKFLFFFLILFGLSPLLTAEEQDTKTESNKVTQSKTLPYFNHIVLSGIGNLHITQGKEQNLVVKAESYLLPNIQATVKDETLYLDFKEASDHARAEVNYYLTIQDLKSIQSFSSASVYIQGGLETNELALEINSFGEINAKLSVDKLIARIEGAGKIKVTGRAELQEIYIGGAGEFTGVALKGRSVLVNITGSGAAKVDVEADLSAMIVGDGSVGYCGSPAVSKKISGQGIVEPLSSKECK